MAEREVWLDIARAIAIILVVCSHCDNFSNFSIQKFAGLFFMPLFIFISGYLYKNRSIDTFRDLKSFIKRRVIPIYKYYLTYELVFYLLTNLFFYFGFYSSSVMYGDKIIHPIASLSQVPLDILKIVCLMGREPFCAAFWFFIALIFVTILYGFIRYISGKTRNESLTCNVLVLICFVAGCVMRYTTNIPRLSPSLTLILFYHLGNLYYNYNDEIEFNTLSVALLSIIGLLVLYNYGSVSMNRNFFTDPVFLIICSVLGIMLVFYISRLININGVLAYIGQNTLPIIAFHLFGFKIIMIVQLYFGVISFNELALLNGANNDNYWYILYVLAGVFIPLGINKVIKKVSESLF